MSTTYPVGILIFLEGLGIAADDVRGIEPLAGGVSNDVYAVTTPSRELIVKRALARLRVTADWHADVSRLDTERRALQRAHSSVPRAVPRVLGYDESFLAMEKAPATWRDWKSLLLDARIDVNVAASLGRLLGTWQHAIRQDDLADFADTTVFRQLRIEPFHLEVARVHPTVTLVVESLVADLLDHPRCLVHGDFSPKNVLTAPPDTAVTDPWVIDWEVAHLGNPVFDPAFLTSHLLLKALRDPASRDRFAHAVDAFLSEYRACGGIAPEEQEILRHVGALVIARVDGKSPVTYLTDDTKREALQVGTSLLRHPQHTIASVWRSLP